MRESFVFYRSFYESFKKFPKKERLQLFEAVCAYALDEIEPEDLPGMAEVVFTLLKPQLDANLRKYENGLKGGRPSKPNGNQTETKAKPKRNQTETKPKPNDNVNDNDNVNEPGFPFLSSSSILNHLNETTGSSYQLDQETADRIAELKAEGYREEDFIRVIDSKATEWLDEPKMRRYLRPSTLFGPKFREYAGAPEPIEAIEEKRAEVERDELIRERDGLKVEYSAIDTQIRDLERDGYDKHVNEWHQLDTKRFQLERTIENLNKRIAAIGGTA